MSSSRQTLCNHHPGQKSALPSHPRSPSGTSPGHGPAAGPPRPSPSPLRFHHPTVRPPSKSLIPQGDVPGDSGGCVTTGWPTEVPGRCPAGELRAWGGQAGPPGPRRSPQEEAPDGPGEGEHGAERPALGDVEGQGQRERVWVVYFTTMSSSVTVMAATSQACWPSFLWSFLQREAGAGVRLESAPPPRPPLHGPGPTLALTGRP